MYHNTSLLRPPGPFPFQSAKYLEHTLVQAAKVAIKWSQPKSDPVRTRSVEKGLEGNIVDHPTLLFGRWLIAADSRGIRCYDLDSPEEWDEPFARHDEEGISFMDSQGITNLEGLKIVFVVLSTKSLRL